MVFVKWTDIQKKLEISALNPRVCLEVAEIIPNKDALKLVRYQRTWSSTVPSESFHKLLQHYPRTFYYPLSHSRTLTYPSLYRPKTSLNDKLILEIQRHQFHLLAVNGKKLGMILKLVFLYFTKCEYKYLSTSLFTLKLNPHTFQVSWLASWTENVQGNVKYVMLNAGSKLKVFSLSLLRQQASHGRYGVRNATPNTGRERLDEVRSCEETSRQRR